MTRQRGFTLNDQVGADANSGTWFNVATSNYILRWPGWNLAANYTLSGGTLTINQRPLMRP